MKNDYYFVYETTNLINNKKYRGIHKTKNINDGYIGSGTAFIQAVKKYGKENFKREILEYCDSYDELLEKEKYYVDDNWVKNRSTYNIKTGGQSTGILSEESKKKISETLKEKYKTGELIPIIGDWIKKNGTWLKNGGKISDETKLKFSESGKKRWNDNDNHPLKIFRNNIPWNLGKKMVNPMKDEIKIKISETLKEKYKTTNHKNKGKPAWNKGKIGCQIAWNKGKKMEKIECPHCGKFIDKLNAKKWHFDNCKNNPSKK